jgi:hypothetical protein
MALLAAVKERRTRIRRDEVDLSRDIRSPVPVQSK